MNVSDTEVLICFAYQEQVTFKLWQSPLVSDLSSDFSQTPFLFQSDIYNNGIAENQFVCLVICNFLMPFNMLFLVFIFNKKNDKDYFSNFTCFYRFRTHLHIAQRYVSICIQTSGNRLNINETVSIYSIDA